MAWNPFQELRRRQMYPNYREYQKDTPWFLPPVRPRPTWDWRYDEPVDIPDYSKPKTPPLSTPADRPGFPYNPGDSQGSPANAGQHAAAAGQAPARQQTRSVRGVGLSGVGLGRFNGGRNTISGRRPM